MNNKPIKVGDAVSLAVGSASYIHFIDYMPIRGKVIEIDSTHKIGHIYRAFHVEFTDKRTSWYSRNELTKSATPPGKEGIFTSEDFPG